MLLIFTVSFHSQVFGPVQCILSFKSQQEVIERANSSQYGLVSAIFTTSMDRALSVSASLETGTVWYAPVHCPLYHTEMLGTGIYLLFNC